MNSIEISRNDYLQQLRKLTLVNLMACDPFQNVLQTAAQMAGYYDFQLNNLNRKSHILKVNDDPSIFSIYHALHELSFYTSLYTEDQRLILVIDPMTGSSYIDAAYFYETYDEYDEISSLLCF